MVTGGENFPWRFFHSSLRRDRLDNVPLLGNLGGLDAEQIVERHVLAGELALAASEHEVALAQQLVDAIVLHGQTLARHRFERGDETAQAVTVSDRTMVMHDDFDPNCPSRAVLDLIGSRWTVLVIGALTDGPRRFGELQRAVGGISAKVLTKTLRALERDGAVTRTLYPEIPPRTEYALTELGRDLVGPLAQLRLWAETHIETIIASRAAADARGA